MEIVHLPSILTIYRIIYSQNDNLMMACTSNVSIMADTPMDICKGKWIEKREEEKRKRRETRKIAPMPASPAPDAGLAPGNAVYLCD
jgi:hypothetical protein